MNIDVCENCGKLAETDKMEVVPKPNGTKVMQCNFCTGNLYNSAGDSPDHIKNNIIDFMRMAWDKLQRIEREVFGTPLNVEVEQAPPEAAQPVEEENEGQEHEDNEEGRPTDPVPQTSSDGSSG